MSAGSFAHRFIPANAFAQGLPAQGRALLQPSFALESEQLLHQPAVRSVNTRAHSRRSYPARAAAVQADAAATDRRPRAAQPEQRASPATSGSQKEWAQRTPQQDISAAPHQAAAVPDELGWAHDAAKKTRKPRQQWTPATAPASVHDGGKAAERQADQQARRADRQAAAAAQQAAPLQQAQQQPAAASMPAAPHATASQSNQTAGPSPSRSYRQKQPQQQPPSIPSMLIDADDGQFTLRDLLRHKCHGLTLRSYQPGDHNGNLCPKCHGGRSNEPSFNISIKEDGRTAFWKCHRGNCSFTGGASLDAGSPGERLCC